MTLSEAQTLLPVLGALIKRAREAAVRAGKAESEIQDLSQRIFLMGGLNVNVAAAARQRAERDKAVEEAKSTIEEIEEIGAQVKDLDEQSVEIACTVEGRQVLLGWKVGEPEITHWREQEDAADIKRVLDHRFGKGERLN